MTPDSQKHSNYHIIQLCFIVFYTKGIMDDSFDEDMLEDGKEIYNEVHGSVIII